MKTVLSAFTLLLSIAVASFANAGQVANEGQLSIVTIRGSVKDIEVEDMGQFKILRGTVQGQLLAASKNVELNKVNYSLTQGVRVSNSTTGKLPQFNECEDAIIVLSADEGNFLTRGNRERSYSRPSVVAFTCLK